MALSSVGAKLSPVKVSRRSARRVRASARAASASASSADECFRREFLASLALSSAALAAGGAAPALAYDDPTSYKVIGNLPAGYEIPPINMDQSSKDKQRYEYAKRVVFDAIRENVDAPWEDCVRLALMDAGTYVSKTKTGGCDSSIRFELDRAENKGLKDTLASIEKAKKVIDKDALLDYSWADMIAISAHVKAVQGWEDDWLGLTDRFPDPRVRFKKGKSQERTDIEFEGGFAFTYGSSGLKRGPGCPGVQIGRIDATAASPDGLIPKPGSSAAEYIAWFKRIGMSGFYLAPVAPFISPDGSAEAVLRESPDMKGFFELLDKGNFYPGNTEGKIAFTLEQCCQKATFDPDAYINPVFVSGKGWVPRGPTPQPFGQIDGLCVSGECKQYVF